MTQRLKTSVNLAERYKLISLTQDKHKPHGHDPLVTILPKKLDFNKSSQKNKKFTSIESHGIYSGEYGTTISQESKRDLPIYQSLAPESLFSTILPEEINKRRFESVRNQNSEFGGSKNRKLLAIDKAKEMLITSGVSNASLLRLSEKNRALISVFDQNKKSVSKKDLSKHESVVQELNQSHVDFIQARLLKRFKKQLRSKSPKVKPVPKITTELPQLPAVSRMSKAEKSVIMSQTISTMAKHVNASCLLKLKAPNWSKNLKPIDLTPFQNGV